jgi:hypothetical protein
LVGQIVAGTHECADPGAAATTRFAHPPPLVECMAMAKKVSAVTIDDVISAIETARDKVMADEVKSLVKLGLPKSVAYKMVAERYRQRNEGEEGEEAAGGSPWPDMS